VLKLSKQAAAGSVYVAPSTALHHAYVHTVYFRTQKHGTNRHRTQSGAVVTTKTVFNVA